MQTIYLDVLLLQSLYVNYFLLRAAARVTHTPLRFARCLLVSAGSSLFSLLIFLPALPLLLQLLLKLTAAAVTVSLAFGIQRGRWLGQFGCFFGCSFLLAGLLLAVCSTANQGFATWSNSCFYLDFSLFQLILFTALAYLLLHLCDFFRGRRHHTDEHFQVLIRLGGRTAVLEGMADTGNNLTDLFSGRPVIVCGEQSLEALLSGSSVEQLQGYRLLPCTTVTANGLLPLFRPDEICIRNLSSGKSRTADGMVGIGGTQKCAIFHPRLLEF